MSRRVTDEFTAADLTTGELRGAPRTRRWVTITVVTALVLVLAAVGYGLTFAPDHYAQWRAAPSDGSTPVRVIGGANASADRAVTVTPEAGWVVQPLVTDIVSWPPLPALRDWTVLAGAETGVQVLSPDRKLRVELAAASPDAAVNAAWLVATEQVSEESQADVEPATVSATASAPTVRTETLASGAALQHVDNEHSIRAVVVLGDTAVRVVAHTAGDINVYRPAIAQLLESIATS